MLRISKILKLILKISIVFNIFVLFFVCVGGTAGFTFSICSMDLVAYFVLLMSGSCTILFLIISVITLIKSKKYNNKIIIFLMVFLILAHNVISIWTIPNITTVGWLEELGYSGDVISQITDDGKYRYQIREMVNYYFEYKYLILEIYDETQKNTESIKISDDFKYDREKRRKEYHDYEFWSKLVKIDNSNLYQLELIESVQNEFKVGNVKIDIENKKIVEGNSFCVWLEN